MTVREIVDQVIDGLKKVQAPVEYFDQVIVPIKKSINGLEMIVRAWDEQEVQEAQEREAEERAAQEQAEQAEPAEQEPEPVNEEEQENG